MGGDTPEAPTAPSTGQSVQDWANALPQIFSSQMQYAPQQAQQQVQLAQQYAGPLAQAYKSAQDSLYPQTAALQESLAGQAAEGMNSQVPDWMQSQYRSNMNAQLGTNAASPIGADYMSRGLLQQQQDWNRYYQQLGLSVTGRNPLTQATGPQTSDYLSSFTPGSVMNSNNQNYGTAAGIYGNQLQAAGQQNAAMMNLIGSGIGAAGAMASGGLSAMGSGGMPAGGSGFSNTAGNFKLPSQSQYSGMKFTY